MNKVFLHKQMKDIDDSTKETLSFIVREGDSYLRKLINYKFDKERTDKVEVFWLEIDEEIVGWATGHIVSVGLKPDVFKKQTAVEINVCIKNTQRRKGYSYLILNYAKEKLKKYHLPYISFPWSDAGIKCYQKVGIRTFDKSEEIEYYPLHEKGYLEKTYGKRISKSDCKKA